MAKRSREFVVTLDESGRTSSGALSRLRSRFLKRLRRDADTEELVKRGLQLDAGVQLGRGCYFSEACPWLISVGRDSVIGMNVAILSHDNSTKRHIGYTAVGRVAIGRGVYLGAQAVVLPGVTIGDDAIIGAGSVVASDIPPRTVAAGNPARVVRSTDEFAQRHIERLREAPKYDALWDSPGGVPTEVMRAMREQLADGRVGYIP